VAVEGPNLGHRGASDDHPNATPRLHRGQCNKIVATGPHLRRPPFGGFAVATNLGDGAVEPPTNR